MFKNIFSSKKENKENQPSKLDENSASKQAVKMPAGHEKYKDEDKEKCPYFQFQKNSQSNSQQQQTATSQSVSIPQPTTEGKKVKKPKGGCPFMPSENKKNPPLGPQTEGWDQDYISPFSYLLEYKGFMGFNLGKKKEKQISRVKFDTYPIYLQHTLFHDDETMKKVRQLEVSQRFFAFDKFRERGNKEYTKENYEQALLYYERSLSCFKWLEYTEEKEEDEDEEKKDENGSKQDENLDKKDDNKASSEETKKEDEEQEDEMQIELEKESEEEKKKNEELIKQIRQEQKEQQKQYKSLMKTYHDDNVTLKDGEDLTDTNDIDMRKSMLMTIYMLIGLAYMKLNHFTLARKSIEDGINITDKSSQIFYRRSQTISFNKFSTLEQLEQAKGFIERAIEMKKYEKIFQSEPGILRIMNLQNHEEAYIDQAHHVMKRIGERKAFEVERIKYVLEREKHIEAVEQELINEGKIPKESKQEEEDAQQQEVNIFANDENMEQDVIKEMVRKYYRAQEFYTETKKPDQVKLARMELQDLFETVNEMNYYLNLDFANPHCLVQEVNKDIGIDFTSQRIIKRLNRIKRDKAKEIFEKGKYNFEVFKYALEDYFKKKEEEKKEKEKPEEPEEVKPQQKNRMRSIFGNIFSVEFGLQVGIVMILFFLFFLLNRNNSFMKNLFSGDSKDQM